MPPDPSPTPRISLALTFHNHQPVGNFGWVIADACERAYAPMVEALERHPAIRVALHYTGPLTEWIAAERPELIRRISALVDRGQVEMVGGGWFEPVLASLPERDRLTQLERMADEVEAAFGARPAGAWLAERVWEPSLPTSLAAAGYRWTIVDDEHFRAASVPDDGLWGPYTTEDQGRAIAVFGSDRTLRYGVPFAPVEEVIRHLRDQATPDGRRLATMGDDGEKFGAWPTTYEHCWGANGWVEAFFAALEENVSWLTTTTPSEWLDRQPAIGRVYLPTSSYTEMTEWALPPDEGPAFARVLARARDDRRPEARWLRGGFWRNFQVKYREINDLHKQMLRASAKVAAMGPGAERDRATDELGRGQSNDCYWHGLFGGVYLAHMRLATYAHLIAAEDVADRATDGISGLVADLDLDGRDEVLLAGDGQVVTVKPDEGAGIGSWDVRAARHALLAVMRRRPESYHARMLAAAADDDAADDRPATDAGDGLADPGAGTQAGPTGVTSIHEIAAVKEPGLADRLRYDHYERRSGLVHLLDLHVDAAAFASGEFEELLDRVDAPFTIAELSPTRLVVRRQAGVRCGDVAGLVRIERTLVIGGGRLDPWLDVETVVTNVGDVSLTGRLALEWNVMLLGGGGNPDAWWDLRSGRIAHDGTAVLEAVGALAQGNDWLGLRIDTAVTPPCDAWIAPIETVSNSESGFEAVYQGSCLLISRPIGLRPGDATGIRVRHSVAVAVDRATIHEHTASDRRGGGS